MCAMSLEKTIDLAGLSIDVDVEISGSSGETGDGLNVGSECIAARLLVMSWNMDMYQETYRYPAPAAILTSLIGTVKPVGAPFRSGS